MAEAWETPFQSAEEAFFNMVSCQKYAAAGARLKTGEGKFRRPGSAIDTRLVIERLYRERKLSLDHINVLRWYGKREMRPDERREKEARAAMLWDDAMALIGLELLKKGMLDHDEPAEMSPETSQYCRELLFSSKTRRNEYA
jgi:hypothetical protein